MTTMSMIKWAAVVGGALLGAALPASAQTSPQTEFSGWLCEIDLGDVGFPLVGSVFTFDSRKICTGSSPDENIRIECRATVPNWTSGSSTNQDVPCLINGKQCGLAQGFVEATSATLNVNSNGDARLNCRYNP